MQIAQAITLFIASANTKAGTSNIKQFDLLNHGDITLVARLFPKKKVACKIVSDNPNTVEFFKYLHGFDSLIYILPAIDLIKLAKEARPEKIVAVNAMISVNSLNHIMVKFDYIKQFQALN